MTRDAFALVGCNMLFLLAGAGVSRAMGVWRSPAGLARALGLAYPAGVAATGVALGFCSSSVSGSMLRR